MPQPVVLAALCPGTLIQFLIQYLNSIISENGFALTCHQENRGLGTGSCVEISVRNMDELQWVPVWQSLKIKPHILTINNF